MASDFDDIIAEAAAQYGHDPELLRALIAVESSGNPQAVSPVGAQGLMQLMPPTAQELGVTNPFDPRQNILGGARYLRKMQDRFGGNLEMALAAYNAGPGNVLKKGIAAAGSYPQKVLSKMPFPIFRPPAAGMQGMPMPQLPVPQPIPAPMPPPMSEYLAGQQPDEGELQDILFDIGERGSGPMPSSFQEVGPSNSIAGPAMSPALPTPPPSTAEPGGWKKALTFGIPGISALLGMLIGGGESNASYALGGLAKGFASQAHADIKQKRERQLQQEDAMLKAAEKIFDDFGSLDTNMLSEAGESPAVIQAITDAWQNYSRALATGKVSGKEAQELLRARGMLTRPIEMLKQEQTARDTERRELEGIQRIIGDDAEAMEIYQQKKVGVPTELSTGGTVRLTPEQAATRDISLLTEQRKKTEGQQRAANAWQSVLVRAEQAGIARDRLTAAMTDRNIGEQVKALLASYATTQDPATIDVIFRILTGRMGAIATGGDTIVPPPGGAPTPLPSPTPTPGSGTVGKYSYRQTQ